MNPLRTLRDWWHKPVTDRLDAIEAGLQPQFYKLGAGRVEGDVDDALVRLEGWGSRSVFDRGRCL